MTIPVKFVTAAAAIGALAAPAAGQHYPPQQTYPQQYPQTYPQEQTYPQQAYPYGNQGYGDPSTGNPVTDIIDSLLGNRYSVSDRQAVRSCANAARTQAAQEYGGYGGGYGGYNNGYAPQGYGGPTLSFRCNVAYNGVVTGIRIGHAY